MSLTSDWERVRILFHEALDQPPEDRAAFLQRECAGDDDLRREVESLLAAERAAGQFLEAPAYRAKDDARAAPPTTLAAGERIGDFEVVAALGSGGMGEVFRARDLELHREVALKLLPRPFARDPQRLARFERESRILASLSHPYIAAIHSIEHVDDLHLLVLELVEGPTLADRINGGPLPQLEALQIARQLAEALEAAHDRGIVHRDLKPANIKTPPAGIKLLDFGLAKEHVRQAPSIAAPVEAAAPDRTTDGLILGTCAYMSPEQARGKPVDKRTDNWAFGCVLFEMLTGRRAFDGETLSDTVAAVLERQPDWTCLPAETAPGVVRLLRRCLEKDPARRLHDIADARLEIEDALVPDPIAPSSSRLRQYLNRGLLLALAATVLGVGWWLRSATGSASLAAPTTFFTWPVPAGLHLDSPAVVSPDGRVVAFTARPSPEKASRLFVRALQDREARAIEGTDWAKQPFWSPDSRAIAYFARGRLMKVAIDGGGPVEICAVRDGRGGAWGRSGVILFTPNVIQAGLLRVSAGGGTPLPATLLDTANGENSHRWPVFLPDGVHFLYHARAVSPERRGVYLGRVDRAAALAGEPLFRSESEAIYVPLDGEERGALISVTDGQVELRSFDVTRNALAGDPVRIGLPAASNTLYHPMMVSASTAVLTYASEIPYGQRLASVRRDGTDLRIREERASQNWPRLSPDGRRIVRQRIDAQPGRPLLWVENLERGTQTILAEEGVLPVWSPDGGKIAYLAGVHAAPVLTIVAADGTGAVSTISCPAARCDPSDWSNDGRWLLVTVFDAGDQDVWLLSLTDPARSRPLLDSPFIERDARFSPDGRFVAYVSHQTGQPEVSLQAVEGAPRRDVVSVGGGDQPVWRRDGRELFFVDPDGMLRSAPVRWDVGGKPSFGSSGMLGVPRIGSGHWSTQYDVSADGQRIHFLDRRLDPAPTEFGVVIGWRALLPPPE